MTTNNSPLATYIALVIGSLSIGYLAGVGSRLGFTRGDDPSPAAGAEDSDSGSDDEAKDEDLASVQPGMLEPCKMVSFSIFATFRLFKCVEAKVDAQNRCWWFERIWG